MEVELLKTALFAALFIFCLARGLYKPLLVVVGVTFAVDAFTMSMTASVTPIQLLGLIYLPLAFLSLPAVVKTTAGRLLVAGFVLMALLAIVYGWLFPWPDTTGIRPWNQQAPGRSLVRMGREAAELSGILFVANRVYSDSNIDLLFKSMIAGSALAAAGLIVEATTGIALYDVLQPLSEKPDLVRFRGLNGEPRSAGWACVVGMLLLFRIPLQKKWRYPLFALILSGLVLSVSTSALILVSVGTVGLLLIERRFQLAFGISLMVTLGGFAVSSYDLAVEERWEENAGKRLGERVETVEDDSLDQVDIAQSLEPFDGSAFLFFWHNPKHLLLGAGPGLMSLPASEYVPPGDHRATWGDRIDSLPGMGILSIPSNRGLVGFVLWLGMCWYIWRAVRERRFYSDGRVWADVSVLLPIFSVLYLLQKHNEMWMIFVGIGVGCAVWNHKARRIIDRRSDSQA